MSILISTIYKSRVNILKQLEYRGYDVSNFNNFSIHELSIMIEQNQLDMLVQNDESHKIYIKYFHHKKLDEQNLHSILEELYEIENILHKESDEVIFIINNDPNDVMKNVITQLWKNEKVFCSLYSIHRLQYNILEHDLVPNHRLLNDVEIQTMKEKYTIVDETKQLPQISRFDPVSLAIGLKPGDICEITRNSPTAIYTKFYRYCI